MPRALRSTALLAALVLAAACSSTEGTTTTTPGSGDAAAMVNAALGGTQSVQDFLIHLDLAVQTDDGPVSFLDEVLSRAEAGAGPAVDLAGGHIFRPVDSLVAVVVDADGRPLPSVRVDFALLGMTAELAERTRGRIMAALVPDDGAPPSQDLFERSGEGDDTLLVEIATASYDERRTHMGSDDAASLDLSFVTAIAPGDRLRSVHLFGQTLPGDPAVEAGMSPVELFAYRWDRGLVRLLGDDGGATFVVDDTATLDGAAAAPSGVPLGLATAADDGDEGGGLDPVVRRQVMKAWLKLNVKAQGFRAGEREAERMVAEATTRRGFGVSMSPSTEFCIIHGPIDNVAIPGHVLVGVKDSQYSPGCLIVAVGPIDKFKAMMGVIYEHAACKWFEAQAKALNNPSTPTAGVAGSGGVTATTSTTEPPATTAEPLPPPHGPENPNPLGCDSPARPARAAGGIVGDVHLITIDQHLYDNQAAGEFLVFDNGVATVQMRTEPWPLSDVASVATAVAVRVGGRAVSMHRGGAARVDGDPVELERGVSMAVGDGALLWTGAGWVVSWPDGTKVTVDDAEGGAVLLVYPSDRPITGMLGNGNGDPRDDLVTRAGVLLSPGEASGFETFYATFIESWRITAGESLFHYGPGESAEGFQLDGFPARRVDVGDLGQVARAGAEEACRAGGVTRPDLLAACVFDIAVTGHTGFAYDTFSVQAALPPPPEPEAPLPQAGGEHVVVVGGLTVQFGPVPPVRDPDGFSPRWRCAVTATSFSATSGFMETPDRQVDLTVQYVDTPGGESRLSVLVELNRQPLAWIVPTDPPGVWGSVETLSFDGTNLEATGTAFLNDPLDPNLGPFGMPPAGARLLPFALRTSCAP